MEPAEIRIDMLRGYLHVEFGKAESDVMDDYDNLLVSASSF